MKKIITLAELKKSGYKSKTIRQELAENLKLNLKTNKNSFEGLIGYDTTVIPDIERAILSGHNINLLGLRAVSYTHLTLPTKRIV